MSAHEALMKESRDLETQYALKNPMGLTAKLLLKRMEKELQKS